VFPFELQLGTGLGRSGLDDWFPAKYRWPILPSDPGDAFDLFPNEEMLDATSGNPNAKFAGFGIDVDWAEWRRRYAMEVSATSSRSEAIGAWLDAFFEVWRDRPVRDPTVPVVAHCPILALDWELVAVDFPNASMIHVVRSPFSGFLDFRRRRPYAQPGEYAARWSLLNTAGFIHAARRPDRFLNVRYESLLAERQAQITRLAGWLGIEPDVALERPSWNGRSLKRMGPFGGVPQNDLDYERANVASLGSDDIQVLARETCAARALFGIEQPTTD
jgi:hypothetical protein